MNPSHKWLASVGAIALLVTTLAPSASGQPTALASEPQPDDTTAYDPGPPVGVTWDEVQADNLLTDVVAKIRATVPGEHYLAVKPEPATSTIEVMVKTPVDKASSALDGTTINGFALTVVPVAFSEEEYLKAATNLMATSRTGVVPELVAVSLQHDGGGLTAEVAPSVSRSAESLVELDRAFTEHATLPVEVAVVEPPTPVTRQNDSSPWYGGGMLMDPGFNPPNDLNPYLFCSTGFAVTASGGGGRMLGARHCDVYTSADCQHRAWRDGARDQFTAGGTDVDCRPNNDTMLINPVGTTDGWVHGGPWDATSSHARYHLKVAGSDRTFFGEKVCTSGANSGEHCSIEVQDLAATIWDCTGFNCKGYRAANTASGEQVTTVGGDSGGPVYFNRNDGRMGARGILYGGTNSTGCRSVRFDVTNCFSRAWFIDIETLLDQWNVTIKTTP